MVELIARTALLAALVMPLTSDLGVSEYGDRRADTVARAYLGESDGSAEAWEIHSHLGGRAVAVTHDGRRFLGALGPRVVALSLSGDRPEIAEQSKPFGALLLDVSAGGHFVAALLPSNEIALLSTAVGAGFPLLGTLEFTTDVTVIASTGETLFVGEDGGRLSAHRVNEQGEAREILALEYDPATEVVDIDVQGDRLFVLTQSGALTRQPTFALTEYRWTPLGDVDLVVRDEYDGIAASMATDDEFAVIERSQPDDLMVLDLGSEDRSEALYFWYGPRLYGRIDVSSGRVVFGFNGALGSYFEIGAIDLRSRPSPGRFFGSSTPGQATDIEAVEDVVAVADGTEGFYFVNLTRNDSILEPVGSTKSVGHISQIASTTSHLLATDYTEYPGLGFLDPESGFIASAPLSRSCAISSVNSTVTPGHAVALAWSNDKVFVADGGYGITVLDTSTPDALRVVENNEESDAAADAVGVRGEHVFLGQVGSIGLYTWEDPSMSLALKGTTALSGRPAFSRIRTTDDSIYAALFNSGLSMLEVNDLGTELIERWRWSDPAIPFVTDIALASFNRAYVSGRDAEGNGVVAVVELNEDAPPTVRTTMGLPGTVWSLQLRDSVLVAAADVAGVVAVNVEDEMSPSISELVDTSGRAYDVHVTDQCVYVADGDGGLVSIRREAESVPAPSPSPTDPQPDHALFIPLAQSHR